MNDTEQQIRFRLLKLLNHDPDISQRHMAKKMGISLGKMNFCLSEPAKAEVEMMESCNGMAK